MRAREALLAQRPNRNGLRGRRLMRWLKSLSSSEQVALLFVVLFGFLALLTITLFCTRCASDRGRARRHQPRLGAHAA